MAGDKVSILKKDGEVVYYSTYADARDAANPTQGDHDLIQIWADLTERIGLIDGVDVWITDGVIIISPDSNPTVYEYSGAVDCNIYGQGMIKNDHGGSCIYMNNANTKLNVNCDLIEGTGGGVGSRSIWIRNANKFHLTCNKVYNRAWQAILFGEEGTPGMIQDINLNILIVETGNITTTSPYTGITAIITRGNGFLNIGEVLCRNLGHCLSHREGTITARIRKLTTVNNYLYLNSNGSTVHIDQYNTSQPATGTQKLILYFDEILSLTGQINATLAVEHHEGTGIFIGRRVYVDSSAQALQISKGAVTPTVLPKGFVKINEIISNSGPAMILNDFTDQITFDVNYLEGKPSGDGGVIFSFDAATFVLKNATIRNKNTGSTVPGIGLYKNAGNGNIPTVTLWNAKIISNGPIIFYNTSSPSINIKTFGLFGNKDKASNINFQIATSTNYLFVYSSDLT